MAFPPPPPAYVAVQTHDWMQGVDLDNTDMGIRTELFKVSDAYVLRRINLLDKRELPLFQALGRWQAWGVARRQIPELNESQDVIPTYDLWDDEWGEVQAPFRPGAAAGLAASKALGVLDMCHTYLGTSALDDLVDRFFDEYDGRPVRFADFYTRFRALAPGDRPLPNWAEFEGWMTQAGHPILETAIRGDRLSVTQRPFTLYPDDNYHNQGALFTVPLLVKYKDSRGVRQQPVLLRPGQMSIELGAVGPLRWAYLNGGGHGWFRTRFPEAERLALNEDVAQDLNPAEQCAYACNQWRMVRHGSEPVGRFYEILLALKDKAEPAMLDLMLTEMGAQRFFVRPEDLLAFDRFAADVLGPVARRQGLNFTSGDSRKRTIHRALCLRALARTGDAEALKLAAQLADRWKAGEKLPGWDMENLGGDPEVYERLSDKAQRQPTPSNLRALASWPEKTGAYRGVDQILDPATPLSDEQRASLVSNLVYMTPAVDRIWDAFVKDPAHLPAREKVAVFFMKSGYRAQLDVLRQRPDFPADLAVKLQATAQKGPGRTLATLPEQIHDFLVRAGYL